MAREGGNDRDDEDDGGQAGTMPLRVLMLTGWSDGPLTLLPWAVENVAGLSDVISTPENFARPVKFIHAPIPTPPIGSRWMKNPWFPVALLFMAIMYRIVEDLIKPSAVAAQRQFDAGGTQEAMVTGVMYVGIPGLALYTAGRYIVAMLAWYSIKQAVDIAAAEVKRGVDVVAAFSWGGGVACWLLADHPKLCRGLPVLMMAPTVHAMSAVAAVPFPSFETGPHVKVLLAAEDPFCPLSQEHVLRQTGAAIYTDLDGGHIFGDGEAQQLIVKLFDQLCEKAGGRAMR